MTAAIPPLIFDLAIMLGIASLVTLFFQKIGQPVVLGYLISGIIIGPYTPPHILVNDIPNIKILSELGVIFLIFSLGLEFTFHKLTRVGFSASITGLFEVLLMTALGFVIGKLLNWPFNDALFLGAALSISSTTIIIKALEELNLSKTRFAELIFGVLVIEDLLAILLLAILSAFVITQEIFTLAIFWTTIKLMLVVGGWFLIGYFLIPSFHRVILPFANEETITLISVSLCLLLASLAAYLNYSIALGAFIMGSVIAETKSIHKIRSLIKPIRDIFAAVFFIATGMLMNPNTVIQYWPIVLIITLVTIFGKIVSTALSSFLTGQSLRTSLRVGFGMAQIGEFSFIIIGLGISLKAINEELYPIIVAVSVITTFTTPYLIRLSDYVTKKIDLALPENSKVFFEKHSAIAFENLSQKIKYGYYRNLVLRLIFNGIMVAIIFTLIHQWISPWLATILNNPPLANVLSWITAFLMSSPFLWGMVFSSTTTKEIPSRFAYNLSVLMAGLLTLLEISFLTFIYFKTWSAFVFLFLIAALLFSVLYKKLKKTYHWFENHLKKNIAKKPKH